MVRIFKGRYERRERLGKGGAGTVYKVWDRILEKEWAMKEFYEKKTGSKKNMELQVLKHISHPSFPRIVDVFEEDEKIYFIMDYVKGNPLEELLKQTSYGEEQILNLGIQIAEALLFLHQLNPTLLYLDLKPSNIMIEENGGLKLIDFGSVIIKGKSVRVSGTPGYASPEQLCLLNGGNLLNEQSDIYSLGMVLFSMIQKESDRLPIIDSRQKNGIYIRRYQPVISEETEALIEKATRGDRRRRYSSMRELIAAMKKSREELKHRKTIPLLAKRRPVRSPFWQQEKSVLFCEGKMITRGIKFMVICLFFLYFLQSPVEAGEEKKFQVFIRDEKGRKVLVKKDSVYEVENSLYFEVPVELIEGEFQIMLHCLKEGEEIGEFQVVCRTKP